MSVLRNKDLSTFVYNPYAIHQLAIEQLQSASKGDIEVPDPSNPFIFLLESSAVNAAACMEHAETVNRQLYPALAQTYEELYLHMSDVDYVGRFATPSKAVFEFIFDRDEVIRRAVDTGVDGIRKITIPRHTCVKFGDVKFTLQYPIDIRVMRHGGLQITYDTRIPSPLYPLTTNRVQWVQTRYEDKERLALSIPMEQMEIKSHVMRMTATTAPARRFTFNDKFYHARVYTALKGKWVEIKTTHTEQVLDPAEPTAQLKVIDQTLEVKIPNVYYLNGYMGDELRVDIYTTEGEYQLSMEGHSSNAFTVEWNDIDKDSETSKYVAPLSVFSEYWVLSNDSLAGGSNGLDFMSLRRRVIQNALGSNNIPITNAQVTARLEERGYSTVLNIDHVTNREFLATRLLPKPKDHDVVSGAGCTIRSVLTSMDQLTQYRTVSDNGDRVTIKSDALYRDQNGVVSPVSDVEVDRILALPPDVRARVTSEGQYLYSPFHYVLERTDRQFDLRAYYLDMPTVQPRSFIMENDTTGVSVNTDSVEIELDPDTGAYALYIKTRSSDSWKQLPVESRHCQLAFKPAGERDFAYLNGEYLMTDEKSKESIFKFILDTNWDINRDNHIGLTSFKMYTPEAKRFWSRLDETFTVFYIATDLQSPDLKPSAMDQLISPVISPDHGTTITQEEIRIVFGSALEGLWSASRTVASEVDYERYASDVPAVYEKTVFARDPVTQAILVTETPEGQLSYQVLHQAGDPVLDQHGAPTFRHRKGEVVLDQHGQPVIRNSRSLKRQIDLFLVEGVYWFATESTSVRYQREIPRIITNWLNTDIRQVSEYLLEETRLYYHPKSTLGYADAIVREQERVSLKLPQAFEVVYYMTSDRYRDIPLRRSLTKKTVETIHNALDNTVVTLSDLYARLKEMGGDDIVAVDISGLGHSKNIASITLLDDSARLSIRKRNVALEDGSITVQDDVKVSFINHSE